MANKIWITAAVTGSIHTPTMSPYLPLTPQQIIDDAVSAYEAGASTVHIHARDIKTGMPSSDMNIMREIASTIKKRCDAIICITTGGNMLMTLEQRLAPVPAFKPELASLNAGSINFVFTQAAESVKKTGPKTEWEVPYLERSYEQVFMNSFKSLEEFNKTMNECGTRPEFEVYDVAMIHNISYLVKKGIVKTPPYIQFVLGILGGLPATVDNLCYLVKTAREQFGEFFWSVAAAGRAQLPMAITALAMGGNVRVGLEDCLYLRPGVLAKSSAEQVNQVKDIAARLGIEIATSNEVRQLLGLKGKDNVAF